MGKEVKTKAQVIQEKEIIVPASEEQLRNLNLSSPDDIVRVAKEVAKYVTSNALSVNIQKEPYVKVEGWQFTAGLLGLVGMVEEITNASSYEPVEFKWDVHTKSGVIKKSHKTKVFKYFAKAVFKNPKTGAVVGQGFAMCSNEERNKHTFDEYAVLSMAQTRAMGKAARMAFAFIIKAAGYNPTPAEEMDGADYDGNTEQVLIPDEIIEKISQFKSVDELLVWAGSEELSAYHKNVQFRNLVKAKQNEIVKKKSK